LDEKLRRKMEILVGKNQDYYIPKFEVFEKTGNAISWNWSAFAFGIFWMVYRKMYLFSFLALVLISVINILETYINISHFLDFLLSVWLWVGFGLFGNYLYYIHVKNKIQEISKAFPDEKEQEIILAKEGGISWTAVFLFIFVFIIVSGFLQSYSNKEF